jgi:adenosine/AMP kinase
MSWSIWARNALTVGAGHSFVLLLGDGFFPINVLNALRRVPASDLDEGAVSKRLRYALENGLSLEIE